MKQIWYKSVNYRCLDFTSFYIYSLYVCVCVCVCNTMPFYHVSLIKSGKKNLILYVAVVLKSGWTLEIPRGI